MLPTMSRPQTNECSGRSCTYTGALFIPWAYSVWLLFTASANTYLVVHTLAQQLLLPLLIVLLLLLRTMRRVPEIEQRLLAAAPLP
jgi:hypothetical protein